MLYYTILLLLGNDIMPRTKIEVTLMALLLVFGEAYIEMILGGLISEMNMMDQNFKEMQKIKHFVSFSLDNHERIPEVMKVKVI